jgi:hypothetical protein
MKYTIINGLSVFVLLAAALSGQALLLAEDQQSGDSQSQPATFDIGDMDVAPVGHCECVDCKSSKAVSKGGPTYAAGRCRVKVAANCHAVPLPCGHHGCGHAGCGHLGLCHGGHGYAGGILHAMSAHLASVHHSGQPLIDPWMRADWIAANEAAMRSWHAGYYHTQWGVPLALAVPPTARMQTRMGWGVCQSTMTPLYHQFERPYPSAMGMDPRTTATNPLLPTPRWPSHTDQFGVYYVRGPW